jgi:hypothetical protein
VPGTFLFCDPFIKWTPASVRLRLPLFEKAKGRSLFLELCPIEFCYTGETWDSIARRLTTVFAAL